MPFGGQQFPVAYWPDPVYPYPWPGEIHSASELEEEWSQWSSIAKYLRLGNVWISDLPGFT